MTLPPAHPFSYLVRLITYRLNMLIGARRIAQRGFLGFMTFLQLPDLALKLAAFGKLPLHQIVLLPRIARGTLRKLLLVLSAQRRAFAGHPVPQTEKTFAKTIGARQRLLLMTRCLPVAQFRSFLALAFDQGGPLVLQARARLRELLAKFVRMLSDFQIDQPGDARRHIFHARQ